MTMVNKTNALPFRVRELGREDLFFTTPCETTKYLSTERRGNHVSVCRNDTASGLTRTLFVSVGDQGELVETYGNQDPVTL
tara:strand:+ start:1137 stop:1379 length:243 start_codon:yes stop_codon:yes gene_type:complete